MPCILSVGQCGYDQFNLSRHLKKGFGAEVVTADTREEGLSTLSGRAFDLVLVNRILDFDGSSGLDLIRAIKADPMFAGSPVMLVSNFPDAQRQAESLGALPGFGKSDIGSATFQARLALLLKSKETVSNK